jgi:hypothetical protein
MKKSNNTLRYAIWIDRRNAKILSIAADGTTTFKTIESDHSRPERFKGETTNKTGLFRTTLSKESTEQEKMNNYQQNYLKKVVAELKNVNALLIVGSGDTRFELQNAIEKSKLFNGIWIENRASKKLTQRELEIETENHFNLHLS